MRWALTGTPGTGKSTAAGRLNLDRPVIDLNAVIEEHDYHSGHDPARDSKIADVEALAAWLDEQPDSLLVESHIAHLLPVDRVVVLRCHPEELRTRLETRDDAKREESITENVEAERLDLVLSMAVDRHGPEAVYEIDTTGCSPNEVAEAITAAIEGERSPGVGRVDFAEDHDAR